MTQFVDECRREWRRLNVPDAVAGEMAAELEADLHDAEADGLSPEEVLGDGVFDPRSFAAAWASERGVVPSPAEAPSRSHRTLAAAVIGAFATAALVAGIALLSVRDATTKIAIASQWRLGPAIAAPRLVLPRGSSTVPRRFFLKPAHRMLLLPPRNVPAGLVRSGVDLQPAGWMLLGLGFAGIAAAVLLWRGFALPRRRTTA